MRCHAPLHRRHHHLLYLLLRHRRLQHACSE
jgi:hypothetical protein